MTTGRIERIRLDYGAAATGDLLQNLSGVAMVGNLLWTVSDEGRTVECLETRDAGFALLRQFSIDELIDDWPGAKEKNGGAELDLEAIDAAQGALWLCGSHCHVRLESKEHSDRIRPEIRRRPSRHLLARIAFEDDGMRPGKVRALPRRGPGSLRGILADDIYLRPFLDLPSKENGLDIEGLAVVGEEVLLGLRGPRLDNIAVVVHLRLGRRLKIKSYRLSFLDLGGLAIRDLGRIGDSLLIVAGPVGDATEPFSLYRWDPEATASIQRPRKLFDWPVGSEKPEGLCLLERHGKAGLLFVYDRPAENRIDGSAYYADWMELD